VDSRPINTSLYLLLGVCIFSLMAKKWKEDEPDDIDMRVVCVVSQGKDSWCFDDLHFKTNHDGVLLGNLKAMCEVFFKLRDSFIDGQSVPKPTRLPLCTLRSSSSTLSVKILFQCIETSLGYEEL